MQASQAERVAIAKDVIKQVEAQKFIASPGTYVRLPDIDWNTAGDAKSITDRARVCLVCAKGALLLSTVDRNNSLTIRDVGDLNDYANLSNDNHGNPYMSQFFDKYQLDLMEAAFEGFVLFNPETNVDDYRGRDWHRAATSELGKSAARLIAIMNNVIRNNGTFVPEQLPTAQDAVA